MYVLYPAAAHLHCSPIVAANCTCGRRGKERRGEDILHCQRRSPLSLVFVKCLCTEIEETERLLTESRVAGIARHIDKDRQFN